MLIILKMILAIFIFALPSIQFWRDWKHADRRTKRYRRITIGIIAIWVLCAALAGYVEWLGAINSEKLQQTLQESLKQLDKGNQDLIEQNRSLIAKIDNYQQTLQQKEQQIIDLEEKANQAERGIVDVYDFYGKHRMNSPGKISTKSATKEVIAFQEMVQLHDENKYNELIILCHQQIQQTPEWLTPYLFLGIAYANIGENEHARIQLEYVIDKAAGDPAYKQAEELLQEVKNNLE